LFPTLGIQAARGRVFTAADDRPDAERVMVISDALWRRRFGAKPDILGMHMRFDDKTYTVVGVMPPGFDFPSIDTHAWIPVCRALPPSTRTSRGNHRFMSVARLKPGISVEQARTELDGIARRIKQQHPGELTGAGANVAALQDRMVARVKPLL